ncbi:hypothetical protein DAPPUDRAFT_333439 [Daphnia pulex]|uniref:Ubiquitin-like protease family profile domain-containing protein n=1 Tax=Daphnia pulex TaxID=6669 RepID=E9HSU0_DAPPU|nr:hypothetical protein DAPPUDRAFT_333439 [Daphnia pulex]|eukprot:EFX65192.1 hypothetical protein DAPPUDRAFT_333439 [Daphnia pulex]
MPYFKLENPELRTFLENYCTNQSIPHKYTLRKRYLLICYNQTMKNIADEVKAVEAGKTYLLNSVHLEYTNHATMCKFNFGLHQAFGRFFRHKNTYFAHSVSDHNAVTLSQLDAAFLDFNAYVSEAVAIYALQFGGIAIVPPRKKQGSFGENDRFSKVTVTHLRQEYRSCGEGILWPMHYGFCDDSLQCVLWVRKPILVCNVEVVKCHSIKWRVLAVSCLCRVSGSFAITLRWQRMGFAVIEANFAALSLAITMGVADAASSEILVPAVIKLDEPAVGEVTQSHIPVLPAKRLMRLPALFETDVHSLGGGQWFNDSLVDYFLVFAFLYYCNADYGQPFVCSSFFFKKLERLLSTGNFGVVLPNLDMTDGMVPGPGLFEFAKVLIPVCYCDHWVLVVIYISGVNRRVSLVVFYSATLVMEERRHVFTTVKDYVKQAIRKPNAAGGQYHDGNVGGIVANVPRQRPGTLDFAAFVIYYAFKILMCGLPGAIGILAKETLTHFDNSPTMRDLLNEIERCLGMSKTSMMKCLHERERSCVWEVILHETVGLTTPKVVAWNCEAEPDMDSEAETLPETDYREEYEPAMAQVLQTGTNWDAISKTQTNNTADSSTKTTKYADLQTAPTLDVDLKAGTYRAPEQKPLKDYGKLSSLRTTYPDVPITELTGTLEMQRDIISSLHLREPFLSRFPCVRANLELSLISKISNENVMKLMKDVISKDFPNQSGIVYHHERQLRNPC